MTWLPPMLLALALGVVFYAGWRDGHNDYDDTRGF